MSEQNVAAIRDLMDHWARGDWAWGAHLFADDLVSTTFDADGDQIVLKNLPEMQRWLREFLEQWDHIRQEAEQLIDCGHRVLAVGWQHATGRTSRAEISMRIYNVFTFRDGVVAEFLTTRFEEVARRAAGLNAR